MRLLNRKQYKTCFPSPKLSLLLAEPEARPAGISLPAEAIFCGKGGKL